MNSQYRKKFILFKRAKKKGYVGDYVRWSKFAPLGSEYVILVQDRLSGKELIYWQKRAFREFYFRPKYILHKIKNLKSIHDLKNIFNGFLLFSRVLMRKL